LGLEFNATVIAQIIDLLILIIIIAVIIHIVLKCFFKKNIFNKMEAMDRELKEIRRLLEEKKQ